MATTNDPFGLVASGIPADLAAEYQGLTRRQAMAEALQRQAMEPLQGRQAGGMFVASHPLEGIAKLVQAYMGARGLNETDKRMGELGKTYQQQQADAVRQYLGKRYGTPDTPGTPGKEAITLPEDQAGPTREAIPPTPGTPGVKPDPQGAMTLALTNAHLAKNPMFVADAKDLLAQSRVEKILGDLGRVPGGAPQSGATGIPAGIDPMAWRLAVAKGDMGELAKMIQKAKEESDKPVLQREGDVLIKQPDGTFKSVFQSPKLPPGFSPQRDAAGQVTGANQIPVVGTGASIPAVTQDTQDANKIVEVKFADGTTEQMTLQQARGRFPGSFGGATSAPQSQVTAPDSDARYSPASRGPQNQPVIQAGSVSEAEDIARRMNAAGVPFRVNAPAEPAANVGKPTIPGISTTEPKSVGSPTPTQIAENNARAKALEKRGADDAERSIKFEEKIPVLTSTISRLNRLKTLTADDKTYASAGAEIKTQLGSIAQAIGLPINVAKTANTEEYIAHVAELLKERLSSKDYGSGTGISNVDLIAAGRPLPQVMNTPQGRTQIIDAIMKDTNMSLTDATAARDYFNKNSSLRGFRYPSEDRIVEERVINGRKLGKKADGTIVEIK